jgi:hypothetical protein
MKKLLTAFLMLIVLSSCAIAPTPDPGLQATPTSAGNSGIQGQVVLGPTCPVVPKSGGNCADKPYQATLSVWTLADQMVTRFATDPQGRFQIHLDPGDYRLHPERPGGAAWPFGRDQPFTVKVGQYTQLIVSYDSGMR